MFSFWIWVSSDHTIINNRFASHILFTGASKRGQIFIWEDKPRHSSVHQAYSKKHFSWLIISVWHFSRFSYSIYAQVYTDKHVFFNKAHQTALKNPFKRSHIWPAVVFKWCAFIVFFVAFTRTSCLFLKDVTLLFGKKTSKLVGLVHMFCRGAESTMKNYRREQSLTMNGSTGSFWYKKKK